jgi:type IV pilus assembly protein PilW
LRTWVDMVRVNNMNKFSNQALLTPVHRQRGLSLIEVMVALAIGLVLLAGLVTMITNSNQSYGELTKSSRQLENGRYAMELLKDSLQHAGFYGQYAEADTLTVPGALDDPCSTTLANIDSSLPFYIQGYDAPTTIATDTDLTCLADADHLNDTDILIIRRTSTAVATGTLVTNRIYMQTLPDSYVLQAAAGDSTDATTFNLVKHDGVTQADIRAFDVEIYYVSPCNVAGGTNCSSSSDNGSPIPTLKRMLLSSDGTNTTITVEPLVEGIEDFQVEYGIDRSGDNGIPNESATGANDEYVTAPAVSDWPNVMSVRIYLLARNIETSAGYTDNKTYLLGPTGTTPSGPFSDAYKRHLFTSVTRVINPAGRREG